MLIVHLLGSKSATDKDHKSGNDQNVHGIVDQDRTEYCLIAAVIVTYRRTEIEDG
jgi:hypothetical protein